MLGRRFRLKAEFRISTHDGMREMDDHSQMGKTACDGTSRARLAGPNLETGRTRKIKVRTHRLPDHGSLGWAGRKPGPEVITCEARRRP